VDLEQIISTDNPEWTIEVWDKVVYAV
jgi:hypothetical protein